MDLGELLRRHRVRLGLSQDELAARATLSVRAIRDLERGRVSAPRAQSVHRLATALDLAGADLEDLVGTAAGRHETEPVRSSGRRAAADRSRPDRARRRRGLRRSGPPRVGVLGPLTVHVGDEARDLASPRCRALLGLLALHPHQIVAREEIVDTLWGAHPPRTCASLVHVYVGQLRALLEPQRARRTPGQTVVLAGGGYRLEVEPEQLDAAEFDALVARATRADTGGDPDRALALHLDAARLWRGPVLADVAAGVRQHPAAVALSQRRVAAALATADLAGRLGRAPDTVPWLRAVARDEALNEALHARLMLALAASGEQAAALRVFAELRDRLADELGIAPGAELQDAHVRVLRQEYDPGRSAAASSVVRAMAVGPAPPAQLPADVPAFTGRAEHLRELSSLISEPADGAIVVAAIIGTAGVGKTALAVHFAHQVRDRYPDGQLYVNLRGYAAAPAVRPIEALAGFLLALGVPPERVPLDLEHAAALYRSLLADKRVLVLLDNASHADDVRPLLPSGAGSLVLITSRDQLAGLAARDGARRVRLDVLSAGEAHRLLGRLVGPDRVLAELEATAELASLCNGLPLALRIAAANLTGPRERSLTQYAAHLRAGNRLATLVVDGDEETAVRAAFDLSYTTLPEPARRVFRLLGLVPGPDITAEATAALAAITPVAAARLLDRLVGAHLIEEHKPGRYACHDLLRLYAEERCIEEDGEPERASAVSRLYSYYLRRAHEAAQPLFGHMFRLALPEPLSDHDAAPLAEPFANHVAALAWYDAERANVLAAVANADRRGPRRFAWLLADALRGYLLRRMYTVDWLAAARMGLAAAEAEGDPAGQFAMLLSLGVLSSWQSRHDRAIEYHTRAAAVAGEAGLPAGEGFALSNLGGVYIELGRLREGEVHLRAALALNPDGLRAAHVLGNLGSVSLYLGRLRQAADEFGQSVAVARRLRLHTVYAVDLTNLGDTYCLLGRYDQAQAVLTEALAAHRRSGNRVTEATTLRCLAYLEAERGRLGTALALAEQAVGDAAELRCRRVEAEIHPVLAAVRLKMGEPEHAREHYARALVLARDSQHRYVEVDALIGLARADRQLGRHTEAVNHVEQALASARQAEFALLEGKAVAELGELRRVFGDADAAWAAASRALAIQKSTGYRTGVADIHMLRGRLAADRNEPDAVEHWRRALGSYVAMGAAAASEVSRLIDSQEPAPNPADHVPIRQNGRHQEGSIP